MSSRRGSHSSSSSQVRSRDQVETLVNRRTVYDSVPVKSSLTKNEFSIRLSPFRSHNSMSAPLLSRSVSRTVKGDSVVKVGRTERDPTDIVFNEKVVSRAHAEFIVRDGEWFVKDVGSSSGTFVNNLRLSYCNEASAERKIETGDIIRFGVDYRGGQESIYKAVCVKVHLNGIRHKPLSDYQSNQFDTLRKMSEGGGPQNINENCAICLDDYKKQQAVFMSPCGHMWHYRCIKSTIVQQYPLFECIICRKAYDLEEDSDEEGDL